MFCAWQDSNFPACVSSIQSAIVAPRRSAIAQVVHFLFLIYKGDSVPQDFWKPNQKSLTAKCSACNVCGACVCVCFAGCVFIAVTFERCEGPAEAGQVQSGMITECSCPQFCICVVLCWKKNQKFSRHKRRVPGSVNVFTYTAINIPAAAAAAAAAMMYTGTNGAAAHVTVTWLCKIHLHSSMQTFWRAAWPIKGIEPLLLHN